MINTIPDFARLRYGTRAQTGPQAEQVLERMLNCARGGALATGSRLEWRHTARPYSHLLHNTPMLDAFKANLETIGESTLDYLPVSGSTDMGNISQVVPTIHPIIGYGDPKLSAHTRAFAEASRGEPGLSSMKLAAKTLAMTCLDLLEDEDLQKRVRATFENNPLSG